MVKNNTIFSEIQNDNVAYWLGFITADGSLDKSRTQLQIGLSTKDKEHLEKFKKFLDCDNSIQDREVCCKNNGKYYASSYLTIFDKTIYSDLIEKYFLVPNKSQQNIDFLSYIPNDYKLSYILGLFDGDGWFTCTEKSQSFGMCGNESAVKSCHSFLHNYFANWPSKEQVYPDRKSHITYYFNITTKKEILEFCQLYLSYSDKCDLLERKKATAQKLIEILSIEKVRKPNKHKEPKLVEKICPICGKTFSSWPYRNQKYCSQECSHIDQRRSERPNREELKQLIRDKSFLEIGRIYHVSDNAIRKWCVAENLPKKKTEINKYTEEEWANI